MSRSDGGELAATRKLCNSDIYNTNIHFLFQTNILCSSGNASVAFPTIASLSRVLFSPVMLVQPALPHDSVPLQRLSTDTGKRLPPNTAPCSVGTGRPPLASSSVFLTDEQASNVQPKLFLTLAVWAKPWEGLAALHVSLLRYRQRGVC